MSVQNPERRSELLRRLLSCDEPLDVLLAQLREYEWDSDTELVKLRPSELANAISKYTSEMITAHDLEAWAEAIEGREDIGFEPLHEQLVRRIIFELANPGIADGVSMARADSWLSEIESAAIDLVRNRMNSVWNSASREADEFKDPMLVIERVRDAYRSLDLADQRSADEVLAEWLLADDESKRFDALALVQELRVGSAAPALRSLANSLESSGDPLAPFERQKVEDLLKELGAA